MSVTPIFDDMVARLGGPAPRLTEGGGLVVDAPRRPSPSPRRPSASPADSARQESTAFGRGCLTPGPGAEDGPDDEVARLVEGARREAVALSQHAVDTVHLLLAAVRAGGDVGRAFGMRGAGPAVLVLAAGAADEGDPVAAPELSQVARTVLRRVGRVAADAGRTVGTADVVLALLRTGRVADLLRGRGVDLDDLVDVLEVTAEPEPETVVVPEETGGLAAVTVLMPAVPTVLLPRVRMDVPA